MHISRCCLEQDIKLTRKCDECICNSNTVFLFFSLDTQGWGVSPRGAGYLFGSDVVTQVYCKQRTHSGSLCYLVVTDGNHTVLQNWAQDKMSLAA